MARYATARYSVKEAREATWARRVALFFVQLLILTVLLHRFASLTTPAALNLIGVSIAGLFIAIAIAVVRHRAHLVRRPDRRRPSRCRHRHRLYRPGIARLYYLSHAAMLPLMYDVETTPDEPLDFKVLNTKRPADANPISEPDAAAIDEQVEAYPDIGPMVIERSAPEVFSIVHEAVDRLGWNIVLNEAPGETGVGRIEATDRTLIMGFTDDVIIQVKGDDAHAIVDVRSVSRYGLTDLGANAKRIRKLFDEVKTALEKGEKTVLEQAVPKKDETPPRRAGPQAKSRSAEVKSARPVARPLSRY